MTAFSDGVIAIAVTLLVLEIHPPSDSHDMLHGLVALWPSYLAYVLTFMLIGQIWVNHHVMFDHIHSVDRVVLFLNTVLLMDIAFLPFAASVLAQALRDDQGKQAAIVLHGLAFEVAAILFNIIWEYSRHDRRLLSKRLSSRNARSIGLRFRLALGWIAVGTAIGVFYPIAGLVVISAFIPFYWMPIAGETPRPSRQHR